MSWLFGRRSEDEYEEGSSEEYDDEYLSSGEEEDDDHEEEEDHEEDEPELTDTKADDDKSEEPTTEEEDPTAPTAADDNETKDNPESAAKVVEDEEDNPENVENPINDNNNNTDQSSQTAGETTAAPTNHETDKLPPQDNPPEEGDNTKETAKVKKTAVEVEEARAQKDQPEAPEPANTGDENPSDTAQAEPTTETQEENSSENAATTNVTEEEKESKTTNDNKEEDEKSLEDPDNSPTAEEEPVEEVTSTHEKRSLLVLAAEHDRVDILRAILAEGSGNNAQDRDELLNSSIPPLHISITYGSTNAVTCLLRMGADPSVRPDVKQIKLEAGTDDEPLVDIPHMGRFDGLSAWELAFGKETNETDNDATDANGGAKKRASWFGGGGDKKSSIDIAPSKLEGIRHAFTAEALRCIGSDEVGRLKQLLDSGMPCTIDIGGKNLYDWSVEMGALHCEELLRPAEADRNGNSTATTASDKENGQTTSNKEAQGSNNDSTQSSGAAESGSTAVLDRSTPGGEESLSQLTNRIDELESLSKALSSCLDNLAEEVSVCHGLLILGGGATALASHVRSLKALKESKTAELERFEEAWENSEDELAYWAKECGEEGKEIAELMSTAIIASAEKEMNASFHGSPEEEQAQKHQLKAQAAALENKIRKLRASITDLSEESTRDLQEVENRGLTGGINLVRTLREELREIEFALNETKSAEALCRAKIKVIQSKLSAKKQTGNAALDQGEPVVATGIVGSKEPKNGSGTPIVTPVTTSKGETVAPAQPVNGESLPQKTASDESASTGQSNAVALQNSNKHGYFTVDLWEILLRIIGLGSRTTSSSQNAASNVMIV